MVDLAELVRVLSGQVDDCAAAERALSLNQVADHGALFTLNDSLSESAQELGILKLLLSGCLQLVLDKVLCYLLSEVDSEAGVTS